MLMKRVGMAGLIFCRQCGVKRLPEDDRRPNSSRSHGYTQCVVAEARGMAAIRLMIAISQITAVHWIMRKIWILNRC